MSSPQKPLDWHAHLQDWTRYLKLRAVELEQMQDIGGKVKFQRQLTSLYDVGYGVVVEPAVFVQIVHPDTVPTAPPPGTERLQWRQVLDPAQQAAVRAVLTDQPLTLIQGPPGTGKTTVITESVLQLLERQPKARILIVSESHVAVDNVLEKLLGLNPELDAIRIATDPDKIDDDPDVQQAAAHVRMGKYFSWLKEHSAVQPHMAATIEEIFTAKGAPLKVYRDLANSAQVVVATCNLIAAWQFSPHDLPFDLVVVDEVCKATLPEVIAPLTRGRRALLVGDPCQLPPVFCMEDIELQDTQHLESVRERQYVNELFDRLQCKGHVHLLDRQYRMPNTLGKFISEAFYNRELNNGKDRDHPNAVRWIDSGRRMPVPPKDSTDLRNPHEVDLVLDIVGHLRARKTVDSKKASLAVITPYRAQLRLLKTALNGKLPESEWDVQIDTVDAFQGRDADVVIFSAGRNNGTLRFLADKRRMNVALSRSKQELWFVGCSSFLKRVDFLDVLQKLAKTPVMLTPIQGPENAEKS